jgi:hypothetical protein
LTLLFGRVRFSGFELISDHKPSNNQAGEVMHAQR